MSKTVNKVVFNTGILYGKMFFTMWISLYTSRILLDALGARDFGIFGLIAGVISLLSFLNAALATSSQRYFSYSQGEGSINIQKTIFANSLMLHLILGGIIVLILVFVGLFMFDGFLNIPFERVHAAKIIYYFTIITMFFSVISVPFTASLNAHENMLWIAIVNIIEVVLKLAIALSLLRVEGDKLIYYGGFIVIVSIVSFILYATFCIHRYEECTFNIKGKIDRSKMGEFASFSGWNLFGAACGVGRIQGLAIVLNLFFGTIVNAAYSIANQIVSQLNFFSVTMLKSLNPQIMKSEGMGDRERMLSLSILASKYSFALLAIIAIPCIFQMETILELWLKEVPSYTVIFCQLIIVTSLINQLSVGLQSAIQAIGKIQSYQMWIGLLLLCNLPISVILLKIGYPVYSVLVSMIICDVIGFFLRLYFVKLQCHLNIKNYIKSTSIKVLIPTVASVLICFLIRRGSFSPNLSLLVTLLLATGSFALLFYLFSLDKIEKIYMNDIIKKIIQKWK